MMNRTSKTSQATADLEPDEDSLISIDDPDWQKGFLTRRRLEKARIPQRFLNKSLDNFAHRDKTRKELRQQARAYTSGFHADIEHPRAKGLPRGFPKGLFMSGAVGCGKTHLAVAILKGVIAKGYTGLFYNSPDLLRDIRATFQPTSDLTEDDLLEVVTKTDLLVFDDVGTENVTGFVLDRFYLIINERYQGCKPLIITTNLDLETLEARLGQPIVSRILEMSETFGPFPGEDWRRRSMR